MSNYMYLVGVLGQTDFLDFATSEKEAMQLAEEFAEPGGKPVAIWKLYRVGQKTRVQWEDPEQKAPKNNVVNKHRQPWTRDEDLLLGRLRSEGYSDAQIAKKLGRTVRAVRLRQYRANLSAL